MSSRMILTWLGLATVAALLGAAPATNPDAPELSSRQQNLLLQLSDAEANIQAINKALKLTGYKVGLAYDRIDSEQKGNELMDRKGGGPVRWDEFYGRTAGDFYAPGSWGTYHRQGNGKTVDVKVAENYAPLKRPRQFDYIYKANNDQIARARDQIANLARDQAALLARREKHEADQSRLWATLAWEQVKDREIGLHALCRFAIEPRGPEAAALRPVILFLRTTDRVAADGLDSVQDDQAGTFEAGSQRMEAAFNALQVALADALEDASLKPEHKKQGEALKALCKDLSEQCKVIADNYANALDRDKAKQDASKLEFRGQLQESLGRFAMAVGRLDDEVAATARSWGVEPDRAAPTPDSVAPAAVRHEPRPAPAAVALPAATPLPGERGVVRTIDLLSSVDPRRDAVHGKWVLSRDGIQSDGSRDAGLQFAYHPPAEYDLTVCFTPLIQKDCVNVIAVTNGRQFQLNLASMNTWGGIDTVRKKRAFDAANPTRAHMSLEAHHKYTLVLRVRKTSISALIDGKPFLEYRTDGSDLGLPSKWKLKDDNAIGIQSGDTPTVFHSVEVTELSK